MDKKIDNNKDKLSETPEESIEELYDEYLRLKEENLRLKEELISYLEKNKINI